MVKASLLFLGCLFLMFQESSSDQLVQSLDREYIEMLESDPKRGKVEEAAQLLNQTNRSDHWPDYLKACKLLSNTRSKSSVPLLMKYMIVHASGDIGGDPKTYASTITNLTGHRIDWNASTSKQAQKLAVEAGVRQAFEEWWKPNRDKISLDFTEWPKEKLRQYVTNLRSRVLDVVEFDSSQDFNTDEPYRLTQFFTLSIERMKVAIHRTTFEGQIHPVMLPMMLEDAGYRSVPSTDRSEWAKPNLPVEYIPFLASFKRNSAAPQLEQIARDSEQPASVRVLCVLSLFVAGEQLMDEVLLEIAEKDPAVRNRVIAILSLSHSLDSKLVGANLLKYLDDANIEIKFAAIHGMMGSKPFEAIPKLGELLTSDRIGKDLSTILRLLGEMKTREAEKVLCDFLELSLREPRYKDSIYAALSAFSKVSGMSWTEAGAHDAAYYEQSARKAVLWYKANEKARIGLQHLDDMDFPMNRVLLNAGVDVKDFYKMVVEAIFASSTSGLDKLLLPAGGLDARQFLKSREVWRNSFDVIPLEVRQLSGDVLVINTQSHTMTVVRTATTGLRLLGIVELKLSPVR